VYASSSLAGRGYSLSQPSPGLIAVTVPTGNSRHLTRPISSAHNGPSSLRAASTITQLIGYEHSFISVGQMPTQEISDNVVTMSGYTNVFFA